MKNKKMIPGIYNYCDRWCERCTQTSKCLNYEKLEKMGAFDELDISNQKFWDNMTQVFEETKELLLEIAKEQGIDLESVQIDIEEEKKRDIEVRNHILVTEAKHYGRLVDDFFNKNETFMQNTLLTIMDNKKTEMVKDSNEVIRWYQHFIQVKLMSSINFTAKNEIDINEISEFNYSLGSARIALISIERSMEALTVLFNEFSQLMDDIITLLSILEKLKHRIELYFPKVHQFIRPGFDW
jgi:hypothetical protein